MRCLLEPDHIVFLPLILVHVLFRVAVSQLDAAAVRKEKGSLRAVVANGARQLRKQRTHMVFIELGERPAQQQQLESRVSEREQHELSAHRPAFAAAARAAVCRVPCAGEKELALPRIGTAF